MKNKAKVVWTLLLLLAISLFATSVVTGNSLLNIITIPLALIIYRFGNDTLFGEYVSKNKEKRELSKQVNEAMKETIKSGRLFKKDLDSETDSLK